MIADTEEIEEECAWVFFFALSSSIHPLLCARSITSLHHPSLSRTHTHIQIRYSGVMPSNPITVRMTTAVASASCRRDASAGSPTTLHSV